VYPYERTIAFAGLRGHARVVRVVLKFRETYGASRTSSATALRFGGMDGRQVRSGGRTNPEARACAREKPRGPYRGRPLPCQGRPRYPEEEREWTAN